MKQINQKTNVKIIALACGVSPSTVCRALNGRGDISRRTSEKILAYCAKKGFSKNAAASALRLNASNTIICIMPDFTNELFIDKLCLLKTELKNRGFSWNLCSYSSLAEAEEIICSIAGHRPAGIISAFKPPDKMLKLLSTNSIPAVFYDCDVKGFDSVVVDRKKGVSEGLTFMLEKGRRKIILLGAALKSERGNAYLAALNRYGVKIDMSLVIDENYGTDLYSYGYEQIINLGPKIVFDAVMAVNDACATGAIRALRERNLRIPQDVSVCGFDNIKVSAFTEPPLSTVAQPIMEMARISAEFIQSRIQKPLLKRRKKILETKLLLRQSM